MSDNGFASEFVAELETVLGVSSINSTWEYARCSAGCAVSGPDER